MQGLRGISQPLYCREHPRKELQIVCIKKGCEFSKKEGQSRFFCLDCMLDTKMKEHMNQHQISLIKLQEATDHSSDSKIQNWPPYDQVDENALQLIKLYEKRRKHQAGEIYDESGEIDEFFRDFKTQITQKINELHNKCRIRAQQRVNRLQDLVNEESLIFKEIESFLDFSNIRDAIDQYRIGNYTEQKCSIAIHRCMEDKLFHLNDKKYQISDKFAKTFIKQQVDHIDKDGLKKLQEQIENLIQNHDIKYYNKNEEKSIKLHNEMDYWQNYVKPNNFHLEQFKNTDFLKFQEPNDYFKPDQYTKNRYKIVSHEFDLELYKLVHSQKFEDTDKVALRIHFQGCLENLDIKLTKWEDRKVDLPYGKDDSLFITTNDKDQKTSDKLIQYQKKFLIPNKTLYSLTENYKWLYQQDLDDIQGALSSRNNQHQHMELINQALPSRYHDFYLNFYIDVYNNIFTMFNDNKSVFYWHISEPETKLSMKQWCLGFLFYDQAEIDIITFQKIN